MIVRRGLLAKKAVDRVPRAQAWVKSSLLPAQGRHEYYDQAGLTPFLGVGFIMSLRLSYLLVNSVPLPAEISDAIEEVDLVVVVLSGHRHFERASTRR